MNPAEQPILYLAMSSPRLANLSACSPDEIEAIRLALANKNNLGNLVNIRKDIALEEGLSIGVVWVICQVAKVLGSEKALGSDLSGKLALWQVIARVLDQGYLTERLM